MHARFIRTILLFALTLSGVSCKKGSTIETRLKFKNLSVIQRILSGSWRLHYAVGGNTGREFVRFNQSSLSFEDEDSIKMHINGQLWAEDKITWLPVESDIYNESTYLIRFPAFTGYIYHWIPQSFEGDTLRLVDNSYDAHVYVLTKK